MLVKDKIRSISFGSLTSLCLRRIFKNPFVIFFYAQPVLLFETEQTGAIYHPQAGI
jgi:hypothetical protein